MTITITLPDTILEQANAFIRQSNTPLDEFVTNAVTHELRRQETERFFYEQTQRVQPGDFRAVMAKIPNTPPEEHDRL